MNGFWTGRPTLVTGGTGLLGGWLVTELIARGADVVCLVRDWVPKSRLIAGPQLEQVVVVRGDVREQELLERVLGEYEVDTVFHLAAQTIVGIANRNPLSTFDTNIRGTWTLLEAIRRSSTVSQVVVASSDKAYGSALKLPYDEDTPLRGQHPYDVSKSCADLIAATYHQTWGTPVAVTRCGNLYGGGDLNWNRIVPGTIRSLLRDEAPLIRSDGLFTRDYFYVEDAAAAYLHLAERLAEDRSLAGEAFNFSNDTPQTVAEIVDKVRDIVGSSLVPRILGEATNEIRDQFLSSAKARRMLDWSPRYGLDEGLRRTIAWYREFLEA